MNNTFFTFIHIGKCGGSTIRQVLKQNSINHNSIHCEKAIYNPNSKYLIALRNPVERFISAFCWRKYLIKNPEYPEAQKQFFKQYKSVDDLCSKLYKKNDGLNPEVDREINRIHKYRSPAHYGMGIDYYIGDFVKKCKTNNIIGIICAETLEYDIKNLFRINCKLHKKNNSENKEEVTNESRSILKKYLHKDYEVIEKLNDLNLLSKKQYMTLSST